MANELVPVNATPAQLERANKLIEQINEWFEQIPDGGEDGMLSILEQIVAAERPEDLDKPWESSGFEQYLGYALRISNPRKLDSQFQTDLEKFLIVDAVVHSTGEQVVLSTSSVSEMGQILVAHAKGYLPMDFVPTMADKPTANGFYPRHLRVWKNHMPTAPDPAAQLRAAGQRVAVGPEATARIRERIAAKREEPKPAATFDVPETPEF
ncbi:MAG TPA: hypothetical protein VHT26_07610 [Trebonia sp.]|jgi:hypothetical protein|nr:hypothetical protein [Trebonia sp.]